MIRVFFAPLKLHSLLFSLSRPSVSIGVPLMRTTLSHLIGCLLAMCLAGCASAYTIKSPLTVFEESQVFQPIRYPGPKGAWDKKEKIGAEDAWFATDDFLQLHGWYLPHKDPVAIVLFAHGNAGNVATQADTLKVLHDRHRLSVMTFDYRGYGKSEGDPSEAGLLIDARAARKWLARREKIDEKDIVLIGHSLGGGVAVDLAAGDGARGLVLASTFSSLPDVAHFQAPLVPRSMLQNRMNSVAKIRNYHGPLLQIHGDRDTVIPYRLGRKLFDAANEPKQFITNAGAGHNEPLSDEGREALDRFFASLPPVEGQAELAARESADGVETPPDDAVEPAAHETDAMPQTR